MVLVRYLPVLQTHGSATLSPGFILHTESDPSQEELMFPAHTSSTEKVVKLTSSINLANFLVSRPPMSALVAILYSSISLLKLFACILLGQQCTLRRPKYKRLQRSCQASSPTMKLERVVHQEIPHSMAQQVDLICNLCPLHHLLGLRIRHNLSHMSVQRHQHTLRIACDDTTDDVLQWC